jgi:hypothetical protein
LNNGAPTPNAARARAEADRQRRRAEQRTVRADDIAGLRAEIDQLRGQIDTDRRATTTAIAAHIAEELDGIVDRLQEFAQRTRSGIFDAIEARFVALEMALKNPRDELPNPLARRDN